MKIAVLGCGYIGTELVLFLLKKGHHVTAVTRSHKKLKMLCKISKKCILFNPNDEFELQNIIESHDTIILTAFIIKPDEYEGFYLKLAQSIKKCCLKVSSPKRIIYTSSCDIYEETQGQWVDEKTVIHSNNSTVLMLEDVEKNLLSLGDVGWSVCILRLGEVYGPGHEISQIIKQLSEKPAIGKNQNYTNMVHLNDVVGAIHYVLDHNLIGIYNLTDDDHPPRKDVFDMVASKYHFPPINWKLSKTIYQDNKRVSNHKIKAAGYTFSFPNRLLI